MSLVGIVVIPPTIWFLVFYIVLQLRTYTQEEAGEIVPGTPSSAPAHENIGKSALIATGIALILSGIILAVINWGGLTFHDIDLFGVLDGTEEE